MNTFPGQRWMAVALVALAALLFGPAPAWAQATRKAPNILIIWGDDIGGFNLSAYNQGVMGYKTPNIDRIAREGALFTDWYGQQSCTAGRAAFITGQSPIRTGLTKVGLPGAPEGMKKEDPTIDKPFFLWWNSTRMHVFTHLKKESVGKSGLGLYPDGMVEHDGHVGLLLAKLKELGLEDNTIVMYSTDNGAESMSWPDGGTTMFRGEKNTNWEGGYRVPAMVKWPGVIKPGTVVNEIGAHEDMLTTLLAAAGDKTVKDDLLKGRKVGDSTYKVHLDGYDLGPALRGESAWPRHEFIYWTDDGSVAALRYDSWKVTFLKQNAHGLQVWQTPFEQLRAPILANLRSDPFERAEYEGYGYNQWYAEHMFAIAPAAAFVGQWLQSFREYPPRQKPGSFNLDRVMEAVTKGAGDK